jgi:hypothetical protein
VSAANDGDRNDDTGDAMDCVAIDEDLMGGKACIGNETC